MTLSTSLIFYCHIFKKKYFSMHFSKLRHISKSGIFSDFVYTKRTSKNCFVYTTLHRTDSEIFFLNLQTVGQTLPNGLAGDAIFHTKFDFSVRKVSSCYLCCCKPV